MKRHEEHISYIETGKLLKYLELPANVKAVFEWTTGLMRVNCSSDDYESFVNGTEGWDDFYESIVHETFHLYQICTSGFLYAFVTEVSYHIIQELHLESSPVDQVFQAENQPSNTLNAILSAFVGNRDNLSCVDLLEGAAFLAHKTLCYEHLDAKLYEEMLRSNGNTLYSKSYDYLQAAFGACAFHLLPPITYFALQFIRPVDAYYSACTLLKTHPPQSDAAQDVLHMLWKNADATVFNGNHRIKNPISINGEIDFSPFYLSTFNSINYDGLKDLVEDVVRTPGYKHKDTFLQISRPLMFNDGVVYIPHGFESGIFANDREHSEAISIYASLSLKYLSNCNVLNLYTN